MSTEMRRLPRGRHRLSREQVAGSQRMRVLRAMAEVMADKGYARTSVADVLAVARVSRETFYELFSSKEDCFMAAFEEAYGQIVTAIAAGGEPGEGERSEVPPLHGLSAVLEDYLRALASDPASARVFLIEVYAAGSAALERRLAMQRGLVDALADLLGASGEDDRFAVEALVAAIVSLVTARLAVGDAAAITALHGPLMTLAERLGVAR